MISSAFLRAGDQLRLNVIGTPSILAGLLASENGRIRAFHFQSWTIKWPNSENDVSNRSLGSVDVPGLSCSPTNVIHRQIMFDTV
jgi:hypothetical protein